MRLKFRATDVLLVLGYVPCLLSDGLAAQGHGADDRAQFIGGFKGDWEKVPSGQNQESKRKLLEDEGVLFDANGYLIDKKVLWDDFDVKKLR